MDTDGFNMVGKRGSVVYFVRRTFAGLGTVQNSFQDKEILKFRDIFQD